MSLPNGNLSGRTTQGVRETMADRWEGICLGRVDDGVALGQGYRDFLGCFGIPVRVFPLTYRDDGAH
jgi:hypothetical protein